MKIGKNWHKCNPGKKVGFCGGYFRLEHKISIRTKNG